MFENTTAYVERMFDGAKHNLGLTFGLNLFRPRAARDGPSVFLRMPLWVIDNRPGLLTLLGA